MAFRVIPLLACVLSCTTAPPVRTVEADSDTRERSAKWDGPAQHRAFPPNVAIQLVFDTGFSWLTDPNKECPAWSDALLIARYMAGCSPDYVGDPAHKCQVAIRKCSPGCDVCRNLEPGEGPNAHFRSLRDKQYARTGGPWLFGGFDTKFNRTLTCHDATFLAKVMVHESGHACLAAGGSKTLYDKDDPFERGTPGCYDDEIAPFEGSRQCGDPL